jgi:hypothetical protein
MSLRNLGKQRPRKAPTKPTKPTAGNKGIILSVVWLIIITMATKLSRTIGNATPLNHVGRLRWFNPANPILDFGNNRDWRKVKRALSRQVERLGFYDLNTLVAPDQRNMIFDDFMILQDRFGEAKALEILRSYLVESYLCTELVRLAVDFSLPINSDLPKKLKLVNERIITEKKKVREVAAIMQGSFKAAIYSPVIQLPQVAPNAPNTMPAFSLAAA